MFYKFPDDYKEKELAPGCITRIMWGQNIMISIVSIQPNSEVPIHSHPHEQFGFILDGEIETTLGNETKIIKKGDAYHALPNVPHGGKTQSQKVTILDVFHPPREDYMK